MQLWHVGRSSHPGLFLNSDQTSKNTPALKHLLRSVAQRRVRLADYQPDGKDPVAPSAIAIGKGEVYAPKQGKMVPYPVPRALETSEIPGIVEQFVQGARNAIKAGAFLSLLVFRLPSERKVLPVSMTGNCWWLRCPLSSSGVCGTDLRFTHRPAPHLQDLMASRSMVQTVRLFLWHLSIHYLKLWTGQSRIFVDVDELNMLCRIFDRPVPQVGG